MQNNVTPFLMFQLDAEEAIDLYASIFKDSSIGQRKYYPSHIPEIGGKLMSVTLQINGQKFYVSNGGKSFKFSQGFSIMVTCENQEEIDHYYDTLSQDGLQQPCGWLTDKFGISWQIVPKNLSELINGTDAEKSAKALQVMFTMKKLDIKTLQEAHL